MNPTKINDLGNTISTQTWWEFPAATTAIVTGGHDLQPNQFIFRIKKQDKDIMVSNIVPEGVKGLKAASVRTLLQVASQEMLSGENWDGKCRVEALMRWAAT